MSTSMMKKGLLLPGGAVCEAPYTCQPQWEIWRTDRGYALIVPQAQVESWQDLGEAEPGLFLPIPEVSDYLAVETDALDSPSSTRLGPFPKTGNQASAMFRAFLHTRRASPEARLSDALFLPCLPRLLTFSTGGDASRDAWTLGFWLTGGMNAPFTDRQRMLAWVPGLSADQYQTLMAEAGWEETAPERIREATPEEARIAMDPAPARKQRDLSKPFCLPGRERLERFFRERIIDVIDREEAYRRMGIPFPGPTLLVGPPGCGKTYAVERLVDYLAWPSFTVDAGTIASSYLHETSRLIASLFQQAEENAPSVVIMDEMEAWLSARGGAGNMGQAHTEEVAEFLRILPTLSEKRVLLFAMTNLPDQIDPAVRRKGRFDYTLEVEMPSQEELENLLAFLLKEIPTEEDLNLRSVARKLRGRPISDAVFLVREAGRLAVTGNKLKIDQELLRRAWDELLAQSENGRDQRMIGFR